MTFNIDYLRTNKTILDILSKFPPIQNKGKYEFHRRGKSFFYGLKSSDFNKFDFDNGDRIFNYWRDKLVEMRLLLKIFPDKEKGSPYAITPFGIAYLIQNTELDETQINNCINVIKHFYKGDTTGIDLKDKQLSFIKSCNMISFETHAIVFQTVLGDDMEVDLNIDITQKDKTQPSKPEKDKEDFDDTAYHILGNACWLLLHLRSLELKASEYFESVENTGFMVHPYTKEVVKLGKAFGDKVVLESLSEESRRVVEILNS